MLSPRSPKPFSTTSPPPWSIRSSRRLLGDLIQKLKYQLRLTSIVVTHDMRFAERLADRVLFLHQAKARFFGTMEEMKASGDECCASSSNSTRSSFPRYDHAGSGTATSLR